MTGPVPAAPAASEILPSTPPSPSPTAAQSVPTPPWTDIPRGSKRGRETRGNTPRPSEPTSETDFHNRLLREAREILADTNPHVLQVPFQDFMATRMPYVDPAVLTKIMGGLVGLNNGGTTTTGMIHGYITTTPGKHPGHETAAFGALCRFISAVVDLAMKHDEAEPWVAHYFKQTPVDTERINTSCPASYLHLIEATADKIGWHQIIFTSEFKKNKKDALENWVQLLWGCNHVLRNDPRRRFTFGLTAEDDEARFWFFSRSCVVDPESLVHTILSLVLHPAPRPQLLAASDPPHNDDKVISTQIGHSGVPSNDDNNGVEEIMDAHAAQPEVAIPKGCPTLEHLGFDKAMMRVLIGGTVQYRISMEETVYELEKVLCDFKVDELIGRATRVWLVHKQGLPDKKFVMKDVWLEKGSPSESSILQDIHNKVKALDRPDLMTTFGVHFLRPIANAIIGQTVQGVSCHQDYRHLPLLETGSSEGTPLPTTSGSIIVLPPDIPLPRRFVDRDQYRLIFPGVLVPLHQIRDVNLQIQVLRDLPLALGLLHSVGFVHRDLSNTNAMYDPVAKRGVVTDLEYAVAYGQRNEGDVKTGTPFFWSVEVEQNGSYLYLQDPIETELEHHLEPLNPITAVPEPSLEENGNSYPEFVFFHSILHDLESVWWIALWSFFFFVPLVEAPSTPAITSGRQALFQAAFPTEERVGTRRAFFDLARERYKAINQCISLPRSLKAAITRSLLERMPRIIRSHHRDAQRVLKQAEDKIPKDHPAFSAALTAVQTSMDKFASDLADVFSIAGSEVVRAIAWVPQDVIALSHGPDEIKDEKPRREVIGEEEEREMKKQKT
ncbi:hypothetical protein DFH07DRAFT_1020262 [Mycena maculata]|uniref:Fungal-type protein kinase domain-containing protein n=1 Tax=Mycena maculata TaxID=230809 RepID=A0AAD7JG51_9AGAR|nr:hypothetical protein DFH07DRAFT_1020262 [Mycena maculata]